jgi:threonine dehydrogenase-like Zn-dependent dehydrogenase
VGAEVGRTSPGSKSGQRVVLNPRLSCVPSGITVCAGDGRIDLARVLTHTFRLDQWRTAFPVLAPQQGSGALKVAYNFR